MKTKLKELLYNITPEFANDWYDLHLLPTVQVTMHKHIHTIAISFLSFTIYWRWLTKAWYERRKELGVIMQS